jgi:zinc/manganese transport system permease protein
VLGDFHLAILGPAFVAGLLVLASHVPLGKLVLDRGIVFIDLAVAQVAALGVVIGTAAMGELEGVAIQASALGAALLCAVFLIWTERGFPQVQEAMIGVVFVVAASAELILFSYDPHGAEHLKDLLVGQILWVDVADLWPTLVISGVVLAAWRLADLAERPLWFYGLFAVMVTNSVQIVGVFLVFASLIIPALGARVAAPSRQVASAYVIGVTGYTIGLLVSGLTDVPTGAAIVCALAAVAAAAAAIISAKRASQTPAA